MSTIGLIGLGNMGMAMASNLIDAGYDVLGYRRGDASDFEKLGGTRASSPRSMAEETEIILCCIPGDDALRSVISGPDGIAAGDCLGRIVVELSTLSEEVKAGEAKALAAKGGIMLDGAISGLPAMVAARKAIFLLSGDEEAYGKSKAVLESLTENLFYMGEFGAAMKAKLCANILVAANLASIAETLAFAGRLGLDQLKLIEAIREGAGTSLQFRARAERMARGDWDKALGSTEMLTKDVHLIAETAASLGCPMPVLSSAMRSYDRAIEAGYGKSDVASLYAVFASAAGLPVPDNKDNPKND